jgi:hypothetical protein
MHSEIFATVQAAISAPARLGDPGASPRGHAPAGQLSRRPVGCTGPLRWAAAADNDDMREAATALLAYADAWRDADPNRRLTRPLRALARAHVSADHAGLIEGSRP